jgi:hypothetical protein
MSLELAALKLKFWRRDLQPRNRSGPFLLGNQLAGDPEPAVRTNLSAFFRTYVFSGCSLARKLNATNAAQNSTAATTTFR